MRIWHGAGAGRCCPESSSPAPGVQSDLTNVLMASPLKPKLKKRANKTCVPQHVFIIHVLQEWLRWDLLPLFSHLAFNGKASWLAMQCDPLWKTQQTQKKKKSQMMYLWSKIHILHVIMLWYQMSKTHRTQSGCCVTPESSGCPSSCRSHVSPRASTRVFCGLLRMFCSSSPAPASLAPLVGWGGESKVSNTRGEGWKGLPASRGCLVQEHRFVSQSHSFQEFTQRLQGKKKKLNWKHWQHSCC